MTTSNSDKVKDLQCVPEAERDLEMEALFKEARRRRRRRIATTSVTRLIAVAAIGLGLALGTPLRRRLACLR